MSLFSAIALLILSLGIARLVVYAVTVRRSPLQDLRLAQRVGARPAAPRCRRCSECEGNHHWSPVYVGTSDDDPDHPAARAGHAVWFTCKHCPAWREDLDDGDEDRGVAGAGRSFLACGDYNTPDEDG